MEPPAARGVDRVALVLGTWFGCGLSKVAPGTVGSIGALPLHWALCKLPLFVHVAAIVLVTVVGIWAAGRVAELLGQKDPQKVVIDEVAGVLIALIVVRTYGVLPQILAVVAFRFFDITKIGPIRRAEHWPPVGFGIMADDLVAGVAAAIVARLSAPFL